MHALEGRSDITHGIVLAVWLALFASGCSFARVPSQNWLMCFSNPDGDVVLIDTSSDALYHGEGVTSTTMLLSLKSRLRCASFDVASGRIATVQSDVSGEVVRVYGEDKSLLLERQCYSKTGGGIAPTACLNKGGTHVAFPLDESVVAICDLGGLGSSPSRGVVELKYKGNAISRSPRLVCYPSGEGGFLIQDDNAFYRVMPDGSQRNHPAGIERSGLLCGVCEGEPLITSGLFCSWTIRKGPNGDIIGTAKSGHSYANLMGVSPCGEFIAYSVPGAFSTRGQTHIHHLKTGRRAKLRVSPKWHLGTWVARPAGKTRLNFEAELTE